MKKRIKKRLSFLLLTLLGFSTACEKQKNGEPPTAMYGTPHVNIWVGGKVTDKTGTPIPGIEVRQPNSSYKAVSYTHLDVYKRQVISTLMWSLERARARFR